MKKMLLFPLMFFAFILLAVCAPSRRQPSASGTSGAQESSGTAGTDGEHSSGSATLVSGSNGRYLVLFASRSGNTGRVADEIRRQLDCDMLEVVPSVAYASDYHDMLDQAREELEAIRKGTYPSVGTTVKRFDDYEIVFVGYPIWFGSMATPMQAFLHLHQSGLSGKRIALFATSGSSGMSVSVGEARRLCPESEVLDQTLLLTSSALSQTENRVGAWLRAVGAERQVPAHAVKNGNHRK